MNVIQTLIDIERHEVGVREQPLGSNWGPRVSEYIKAAGYTGPVYWCLCFQYWAVSRACQAVGIVNPLPRTGSCDELLGWARKNGHLVELPEPGDLFLLMKSADDAIHTGLVISVSGESVSTIEGNTNDDGSSNGIGVFERSRELSPHLRFVRVFETEWALFIGGRFAMRMPLIGGVSFAPLRELVRLTQRDQALIDWHDCRAFYGGREIPGARSLDGRGHVPLAEAARVLGLVLRRDAVRRQVDIDA